MVQVGGGTVSHREQSQQPSGKMGMVLIAGMALCYLAYACLLLLALHRGAQGAAETAQTLQEAGLRGGFESAVFLLFTIECWRAWFLEMQNDLGRFSGKMARLILLIAVLGLLCAFAGRFLAPEFPAFWNFLEPVPVLVLCFFVNLVIAAIFAHNRKRMERRRG